MHGRAAAGAARRRRRWCSRRPRRAARTRRSWCTGPRASSGRRARRDAAAGQLRRRAADGTGRRWPSAPTSPTSSSCAPTATFDKPDAVRASTRGRRRGWSSRYARQGFAPPHGGHRRLAAGRLSADGAQWTITLPPRGSATLRLTVVDRRPPPATPSARARPPTCPRSTTSRWPGLRAARAGRPRRAACLPALGVPAAGAPWFLTLFGRDSLLTSLFALPYRPELAEGTLRALAALQGSRSTRPRVEEPGKILHELRRGELATLGAGPVRPLLRLGRRHPAVPRAARRAPRADRRRHARQGAGGARPARRSSGCSGRAGSTPRATCATAPTAPGLVHHCWKDSADSIVFRDGRGRPPGRSRSARRRGTRTARCVGTARLATHVWGDPTWAAALAGRADGLRARFAADFRLPTTASWRWPWTARAGRSTRWPPTPGTCCGPGILDEDVGGHGRPIGWPRDDFFSGWGIRTLAAGQPPYHPLSYHRGGVWPHDTAIAVAGLAAAGRAPTRPPGSPTACSRPRRTPATGCPR